MRQPTVELLWWEGCPSTDDAQAMLRDEMEGLGLDAGAIEMREVRTDDAAEGEAFVGSPTIRIDGVDVQPPQDEPVGLTCRVYRLRDGSTSSLPDRHDLKDALARALEGGD
jgi:hypothetical protein